MEFHLAETLHDALKPFAFQAGQQGIRIDLELPLDVPERFVGDPARLRQIIANLAGNAVKFTSAGRISVAVAAVTAASGEATLQFSVSDTGTGIPKERLEQIFEAFAQADNSTSRQFGGTGLGLTISKQLIELMHGRIWMRVRREQAVHSTLRFDCRLPAPRDCSWSSHESQMWKSPPNLPTESDTDFVYWSQTTTERIGDSLARFLRSVTIGSKKRPAARRS